MKRTTTMLALGGVFALGLVLIATSAVGRQSTTPLPDSTVLDTATVWSGRVVKLGFAIEPPYRWTNMFGDSVRVNGVAVYPGLTTLVAAITAPPPCFAPLKALDAQALQLEQKLLHEHRDLAEITDSSYVLYERAVERTPASCLAYVNEKNTADGTFMLHVYWRGNSAVQLLHLVYRIPQPRIIPDPHRVHRSVMQGYVRQLRNGTVLVFGQHEDCFSALPRDLYYPDVDDAVQGSLAARERLRGQYPDDVPDWVPDQLEHPVNLSFFVR